MFDPGNNVDELGGLGKINAVALRLIDDLIQKIHDLTEVNIDQVIHSGMVASGPCDLEIAACRIRLVPLWIDATVNG